MNYIAQSPAVPLAELSHFACHYPLGDPRDEDFGYCGAAAKVSSRYCEHHHRLCYTTSADRFGVGNVSQTPQIARPWSAQRDHSGPLTVWRPSAQPAPVQVPVEITRESLVTAKKERDARMRAATIDPEKEAALLKKREEARLQAEANQKAEQERRFWMAANAVTSFLRGAAEGVRGGPKRIRIADIQKAVCAYYKVSGSDLLSERRTVSLIRPRHVAIYLAKTLTPSSLPEIGRRFGGRDHSTVLSAIHKISALIETDAKLRAEVEAIRAALTRRGTAHA